MPLFTPEQLARERIDAMLRASGWAVQSLGELNLGAHDGVAVREYPTDTGPADYILFVDRKPVGVVEAKKPEEGERLTMHEEQAEGYATAKLKWTIGSAPLPFCYLGTGEITMHWDQRDPKPRAREVFSFHRPETLRAFLNEDSLRRRLTQFPALDPSGLRDCQVEAINNLEKSLAQGKRKALVQMATGSGKTFTAITSVYRLLKPPVRARRVLFLVDTRNLGKQAEQEFQSYTPNDDRRKFTELYTVQRLSSNFIDPGAQVCISTIQRMYSILQGEPLDESAEEQPGAEMERILVGSRHTSTPQPVAYNASIPPEFFDLIIIDECHRSIYNLWRQVLDYFDAFLVGLTATPDGRTYAFFDKNVVSEYTHERAVADGVNVPCDLYLIETAVTQQGATIRAQEQYGMRDRLTRAKRWEQSDEDVSYTATQLDRDVVNPDQIRTVVREFKRAVEQDIYPHRTELPKTLIFAKNDSHADDIIRIVREEFNEDNAFCKKVTYREDDTDTILANFRNSFNPRVAVTVDMIATGTDVKPLELLLFMRDVKSRNYYEQMKGRGTRTYSLDDLRKVSRSATTNKTHFVIVDAVGVSKSLKTATQPLERKRGTSLKDLMMAVHMGAHDDDTLSSLANRLTRMEKQISPKEKEEFQQKAGGRSIQQVVGALLGANDPDCSGDARVARVQAATVVFDDAAFREYVENVRRKYEQLIDTVNPDELIRSGFADDVASTHASTVNTFREFLAAKRDELTALRIYYSQPYRRKDVTFRMVQEISEALAEPPYSMSVVRIWDAYERSAATSRKPQAASPDDRAKLVASGLKLGASSQRMLTDLVSLIRYELKLDVELRPFAETVKKNFQQWVFQKQAGHVKFTEAQMAWLHLVRDHISTSVHLDRDDLELGTMGQQGGLARMHQLFGEQMDSLIDELNEALAA